MNKNPVVVSSHLLSLRLYVFVRGFAELVLGGRLAGFVVIILTFFFNSVLAAPPSGTSKRLPTIQRSGPQINTFVPKDWVIVAQKDGDLNADGLTDHVVVVQQGDPQLLFTNDGLGVPEMDSNPRIIFVIVKEKQNDQFKLVAQNNDIIPDHMEPIMVDPFEGADAISVKKNVFKLHLEFWSTAGSWGRTDKFYTFRYADNAIHLIGYDQVDLQRNTGSSTQISINFLTKQIKTTEIDENKAQNVEFKKNSALPLLSFGQDGLDAGLGPYIE